MHDQACTSYASRTSSCTSSVATPDPYPPLYTRLPGFLGHSGTHQAHGEKEVQGWGSFVVALISLTIVIGFLHVLLVLVALSWSPIALAILAAMVPLMWIQAPLNHAPTIHGFMMRTWREYFSCTFLTEYDFSRSNKNYLVAAYPHGGFPIGPILSARYMPVLFPRRPTVVLAASVLLRIPIARQFFRALGALPATRKNLVQALETHHNVGIVIGGIAEMFMLDPKCEQILVNKRTGFVHAALMTGTDIVPSYHFGNSLITSFGPRWLMSMSRRMRASLGLLYGVWGLPVPRRVPLHVVYGAPIKVGEAMSQDDPRFAERAAQIHAEFKEAIVALYERHKAKYGWADRPIVVH